MNNKIKILLFTDWYEPGFKAGGPIRSCVNFADQMKGDYELYIFTGDRDLRDADPYPEIEVNTWMEKDGLQVFYASPAALNWENIIVLIRRVKPDYLYLNSMYSRYFTIYPLLMKRLGMIKAQVVLAPRGMLKSTAVQYKTGKKKIFFRLLKWLRVAREITFHATDATEVNDTKRLFGNNINVTQIANFSPQQQALQPISKMPGIVRMIFSGRVHPIKNLLFLLRCLQSVSGEITLTIVASVEDEGYWKKCKALIKTFPKAVTVELQQDVPHHQVAQLINEHHLFVLPSRGENFGHAIFEALAAGRPVLISDQTPWRNLQEQHAGWDLPLDDPSAFVQVLQQVADMNNDEFQQWSTGAWQYAKDFAASSGLKKKYREMFI